MNLQRFHSHRFVETNIVYIKMLISERDILNTSYVNSIGKTWKVKSTHLFISRYSMKLFSISTIVLALEKHTIECPLKRSCVKGYIHNTCIINLLLNGSTFNIHIFWNKNKSFKCDTVATKQNTHEFTAFP